MLAELCRITSRCFWLSWWLHFLTWEDSLPSNNPDHVPAGLWMSLTSPIPRLSSVRRCAFA